MSDKKNKFFELRNEQGISLENLAKELTEIAGFTIDRQKLGRIENGQEIDASTLIVYCKHFNVSADYLLGLSEVRTKSMEIKEINKKLGLNEIAINTLINYNEQANRTPKDGLDSNPMYLKLLLETINIMLFPLNEGLLDYIMLYIFSNFENYYDDYNVRDENFYCHISEIGFFDKHLGIAFSEDHNFLSSVFLSKVQEELVKLRSQYNNNHGIERITPIAKSEDFE